MTVNSVAPEFPPRGSEIRRFRRDQGRTICYERHGTIALRANVGCEHGISAAHPAGECEKS